MMTQFIASDLSAQHVGYIVSTPKITGMLQCVLTYSDDEGTIGICVAGYPQVVRLADDDPVVISGLSDLAVEPATVELMELPSDNSIASVMSQYGGLTIKYRAVDKDGTELKVDKSKDKIKEFIAGDPDFRIQRLIWVDKGMAQDWTDVS
jgi:hypothetical protein